MATFFSLFVFQQRASVGSKKVNFFYHLVSSANWNTPLKKCSFDVFFLCDMSKVGAGACNEFWSPHSVQFQSVSRQKEKRAPWELVTAACSRHSLCRDFSQGGGQFDFDSEREQTAQKLAPSKRE